MKHDFYPFNHPNCVWEENNKLAILENVKSYGHWFSGYIVFHKKDIPLKWYLSSDKHKDAYDVMRGNKNLRNLDIYGGLTYCEIKGDYVVFGFDTLQSDDEDNSLELCRIIILTKTMQSEFERLLKKEKVNE